MGLLPLIIILWAFPTPYVQWVQPQKQVEILVTDQKQDQTLVDCIEKGFSVKYKYQIQVCTKHRAWFDSCNKIRTQVNSLIFKELNQNYKLSFDLIDDHEDSHSIGFEDKNEAIAALSRSLPIDLKFLLTNSESFKQEDYLRVKVLAICQRDLLPQLRWLSYMMTLGFVTPGALDSGWLVFDLK